ncbi:MAG: sulfatase-like hydrolase/transferase, partial [Pirellulales bacterium]
DNGDGSTTFGFAAAGDTNLDWQVDILDAANFLSGGKFDSGSPATWNQGDFTYDGFVDILDAASFLSTGLFDAGFYNAPPGQAGAVVAVPEPAGRAAVAVVGGAILAWRRRRSFLAAAVFAVTAILCVTARSEEPRRPNVLVIVADDLGYADPGFQGGTEVPTPHLDALAAAGVRCSNGYVSGPYCSPTRAGLLTGRYQQRFGHEFNPGPSPDPTAAVGLPLDQRTLAEAFRAGGYRTGLVGKWHLGSAEGYHPLDRGFEEFYGFLGGAHAYFPQSQNPAPQRNAPILRGREPVEEQEYLTSAFAREAEAFIGRHAAEPFFLLLAFNAVHTPLAGPRGGEERFAAIADPKRRTYAAMLAALDDAVGRVVRELESRGLADDTLIAFISDNGGPPVNASSNGPLRGHKASTWEGGVRVPFTVTWKRRLPAGKTFDPPVIQLDLFPTALAAAGLPVPAGVAVDGVNLLPALEGKVSTPPHDHLFWRFGPQTAIRAGSWKLVRATGVEAPILVNLQSDPGETTDVSAEQPAKRRELEAAWNEWNAQLVEPKWQPARKAGQRPAGGRRKAAAQGSAAAN